MKKLLSTLVTLVAITTVSYANISYNVIGGANYSNINNDSIEFDAVLGLSAGVGAEYQIDQNLSVQSGLLYSTKGAKMSGTIMGVDIETSTELAYLDVPVLVNYKVMPEVDVFGGAYAGFLLSANSKATIAGATQKADVKDQVNSVDYGVTVGAKYTQDQFYVGANYQLGLQDITKDPQAGQDPMTNSVFQVTAGYNL